MSRIHSFDERDFRDICDLLAKKDPDLRSILDACHYPPCWKRSPSFETLVHIILEQQVSLASALAAMNKLKEKIIEITPGALLSLSDAELKECYFSRQKIIYTRHLASAINNNELNLEQLAGMDNDAVKATLIKIKGVGNWTADVFLMMVLHRSDVFPLGDAALMTSIKETKNLPKETSKGAIAIISAGWKPYQTIAAFILWHSYLCRRRR